MQRMSESLHESRQQTIDLVSNNVWFSPPPGLTTEIVNTEALRRVDVLATQPAEREHLTSFFYSHSGDFSITPLPSRHEELRGQSFAVDHPDDLCRFRVLAGNAQPGQLTAADLAATPSELANEPRSTTSLSKNEASVCSPASRPMQVGAGEPASSPDCSKDADMVRRPVGGQ